MYGVNEVYYAYRKARKKFSLKTYLLLFLWLLLAVVQWILVGFVTSMNSSFREFYYISIITFAVAIVLFSLFLLIEKMRVRPAVGIFFSIIIVELQIIATFALVALVDWRDMLVYFFICVGGVALFIVIGIALPRKMDLSLHVALLFISAFVFLLLAAYFLTLHLMLTEVHPYAYSIFEIAITLTLAFFVMYHAQTIHGMRFAEMRLHDFCLGSLILFHDFLIIYWLTFYWQFGNPIDKSDNASPNAFIAQPIFLNGSFFYPNHAIFPTSSTTTSTATSIASSADSSKDSSADSATASSRAISEVTFTHSDKDHPKTEITLDYMADNVIWSSNALL